MSAISKKYTITSPPTIITGTKTKTIRSESMEDFGLYKSLDFLWQSLYEPAMSRYATATTTTTTTTTITNTITTTTSINKGGSRRPEKI